MEKERELGDDCVEVYGSGYEVRGSYSVDTWLSEDELSLKEERT